jgi:hypothetical protein
MCKLTHLWCILFASLGSCRHFLGNKLGGLGAIAFSMRPQHGYLTVADGENWTFDYRRMLSVLRACLVGDQNLHAKS